jgi:hypothetical protein
MPAGKRVRCDYPRPEQCATNVLNAIGEEIKCLLEYKETQTQVDVSRTRIDRLRGSIPDSASVDRLLRYEASLGRAFDWTLNQLERIQRVRLGQPVLPAIKADISSSRN